MHFLSLASIDLIVAAECLLLLLLQMLLWDCDARFCYDFAKKIYYACFADAVTDCFCFGSGLVLLPLVLLCCCCCCCCCCHCCCCYSLCCCCCCCYMAPVAVCCRFRCNCYCVAASLALLLGCLPAGHSNCNSSSSNKCSKHHSSSKICNAAA